MHPLGGKAKIDEHEKNMFYSQCLPSKKGPLGTIWVAAHCFKRLKKDQVKQTDISSSVDRICDEVEVVTYRILAFLLLGVVRIFSKKVDFLFRDCHGVMRNLKYFAGGLRADKSIEAMRTSYHSITLPERFELDAFDLGVLIDQEVNSCNVRAPEEIMLSETLKEGDEHSNDKYYCSGDNSFEAYSSMNTPVKDVFSHPSMDIDFDVAPSHDMHDFESSLEKLHGIRFSLEERLEPMIFLEVEKVAGVEMPSNEEHQTGGEQIENPDAGELEDVVKSFDEEQSIEKLRGTSVPLEESLRPSISFHAWKAHKISNLPRSFSEPLIPTIEPVETAEIRTNEVIAEVPINQGFAQSAVKDGSEEQTPIAPATPVTHPTSLRLHEVRGSEPASSLESIEKRMMTSNEDQELGVSLMDEEINSSSGDTLGKNECSVRTRKVGRYLYEKFQDQRRKKRDMFINLTQVLKGKSRKESARLFYEILVLKTGDYIDVRQENALGDILVLETPELKNTLDTDGIN